MLIFKKYLLFIIFLIYSRSKNKIQVKYQDFKYKILNKLIINKQLILNFKS